MFSDDPTQLHCCCLIDLFSLYVLFSHFRPRDATRGNSFFQMSSYARANVRITNEKNKRKIPMRASHGLKWENKMYKLKRSIYCLLEQFRNEFNFVLVHKLDRAECCIGSCRSHVYIQSASYPVFKVAFSHFSNTKSIRN